MNCDNIKYPGYNILWNGILCGPEHNRINFI
jgi:hypothetical protein